jgi:hypothetical protein
MRTDLLSRVLGIARAVSPVAPVRPLDLDLAALMPGHLVRAEVLAKLGDGSFRALIGQSRITLTLPAEAKPGDVLTLRLLSTAPQLRFEPADVPSGSRASISDSGRLLGDILRGTPSAPVKQTRPVVGAATTDPEALQQPLARAIERSGLFYEAHQARWTRGEFPLAALREEPQSLIARDGTADFHGGVVSDSVDKTLGRHPSSVVPVLPGHVENEKADDAAPRASISVSKPDDNDIRAESPARETLGIVRAQLETLETRQVTWQGEIWPGQPMRWEIGEQTAHDQHEQAQSDWHTRFALELPSLGDVRAHLAFGARGIHIALSARERQTQQAMQQASGELLQNLHGAGLQVTGIEIHHVQS